MIFKIGPAATTSIFLTSMYSIELMAFKSFQHTIFTSSSFLQDNFGSSAPFRIQNIEMLKLTSEHPRQFSLPNFSQADLAALSQVEHATLQSKVQQEFKVNRYDPDTKALTITAAQTKGLAKVFESYQTLLSQGSAVHSIPRGWFTDDRQIRDVTAFFSWTAWAAAANRPHAPFSYTANFLHDDLIGNQAPAQFLIWSIVSVIVLIAAIALFVLIYITQEDAEDVQPVTDRPKIRIATPSQKVTSLFFGVAMILFSVQILMGMVTAHYAVESDGFYGIPIQQYLPYAASRTWHLQLAVFWIATCWLAAGLYFGPRFGKHEPKFQAWGNGSLLVALTVVVLGSLIGSWASIQGFLRQKLLVWASGL